MPQDHRRTVARDFDNIVGGVGVWLGKEGDDDLVDALAGSGLDQFTEMSASRLEVVSMGQSQHGTRDVARLGARETHHADAAASRRRSNGNDGVVEMHGGHYSPQRHGGTESFSLFAGLHSSNRLRLQAYE